MFRLKAILILCLAVVPYTFAGTVEVLHFWSSGSEAAALDILKQQLAADGHQWQDFVIPGQAGANAKVELQKRVVTGTPPAAAQIWGLDLQRWARLGFLANLNQIAEEDKWDQKLPKVVADTMKFQGQYVAVPLDIHRANWLWVNKPLLDQLHLNAPTNWEEFDTAAAAIQQAGYNVIAIGNQGWQYAMIFSALALSVGGPEYYRSVFVDNDYTTIGSATTEAVFKRYYQLLKWVHYEKDRDEWNQATQQVIDGKAAFQFMGDWAKGEFVKANKIPNQDYLCVAMPGTTNQFIYHVESFAMFDLKNADKEKIDAQTAMVRDIMSTSFQVKFNMAKGSIPARTDIAMDQFDACGQKSMQELLIAEKNHALVPHTSLAAIDSIRQQYVKAIYELTNASQSAKDSAKQLAKAIRYGAYVM